MNIRVLVNEFAENVVAQHDAVLRGDSKSGNKYAVKYVHSFNILKSYGNEGRDALASLFSDPRAEVRVMAAAFLLRHCEEKALGVLESEAQNDGIVAFGAAQTLRRWKEGSWDLD